MRILVVEDEPAIADGLRTALEREGYAVDISPDGDDGWWRATEFDYDAIVLDILLPKRNGYQLCADLRAGGDHTPILMLTAKDGEYDQAEGLDTGADDYVTKPFSMVVVLARLRALLRRGAAGAAPTLVVGDLRLDPASRAVTRGGTPIELTRREFELLRFLMHHHDRVVTTIELLEHVWGDDLIDANVVQVYIGYLRRKIDQPFDTQSIQTVRGVGYRIGQ